MSVETIPTPTRETSPRRHQLDHICATHPRITDPPCTPGVCINFCGRRISLGTTFDTSGGPVRSTDCVVCVSMAENRMGRFA